MRNLMYDLKLDNGEIASWSGKDGINAAERYVDHIRCCGRSVTVVGTRLADEERYGIFLYQGQRILNPGEK